MVVILVGLVAPFKENASKFKATFERIDFTNHLFMGVFGFIVGRIVVLDYLNPFSIAFLCAAIINESFVITIVLGLMAGAISLDNPELLLWEAVITLALLSFFFIFKKTKINKRVLFSILGPSLSFIAGYFIFYIKDYYLYDLIMLILESIAICALTNLYDKGIVLLTSITERKFLSTEEIVSLSLLFASLFMGSTFYFFGLSLKRVISIFLIYVFSYGGDIGAGTIVGTLIGILQTLTGDIYSSAIGIYGLCGLISGYLKRYGKITMIIGFILGNAIMTFYINGSTEVLINFKEIVFASLLFLFIPDRLLKKVFKVNFSNAQERKLESTKIKDYTIGNLLEVSEVFKELSVSLNTKLINKSFFSQFDAAEIIDKTTKDVCYSCGMYNYCWNKDFFRTYQRLFDMLSAIETEKSDKNRNKDYSIGKCIYEAEVRNSLKYNYGLYKTRQQWKKKIDESRLAFSRQMEETSKLISNMAEKLNTSIEFNNNAENQIIAALDGIGIFPQSVSVIELKNSMEIEIKMKSCGGKRVCISKILPEIKKITGKRFIKTDLLCCITNKYICNLSLREAQKFSIMTGFSKVQKDANIVSGDNYSFIEVKDGNFFMILSDGMGSGYKASMESSVAVSLLEKFLLAGYNHLSALEAINSLLLIKTNDDNYATLDISIINKYTGEIMFLKAGAVSTYVKHKNRVDIIRSSSLPAGILNEIDIEYNRRKLIDGDFVIMVTDGALDANKDELDKESWLMNIINEIETRNPQKLADAILEKCLSISKGIAEDDITILVTKIWEPR